MNKTRARTSRPLITLDHCSIVLDGKTVLDDVSFVLRERERWVIAGPNGAGKTLFLKLLRGDMWPTPTGRERRVYDFDESSESPIGAKELIAYVGPERQDRYVRYGWNHTVREVVTTGLFDEEIPRTRANARQHGRVTQLLRALRLWALRDRGFLTLSYGQRRRTLIARALANNPRVLLLDEAFNGLDAVSAGILRRVLGKGRGAGATWILTTHRAQDVPQHATRYAWMEDGKLLVSPSPALRAISPSKEEVTRTRAPLKREVKRTSSPSVGERSGQGVRVRDDILISLHKVDLYREYRLVLRDVNWTIQRGEHWAIFGANGSGKSSLLKLLYGDLHPKLGGTIARAGFSFGTPIAEWKQRVGFVSPELQADYFLARDLGEVVMSGRYASVGLSRAATAADRRAARQWLEFFGLKSVAHRGPRTVSYGQMRRALLARAMINSPELLLLDEPCTGLDPDSRAAVLDLLERLAERGVQLVMAVHERSELPRCVDKALTIDRDRSVNIQRLNR